MDLANEVFTRVLATLTSSDVAFRPMRPWLVGVAFRVAMESRRRKFSHGQQFTYDHASDPAPLPDELLDRKRGIRLAIAALEGLSPQRKAVLVMTEFEGIPMPEIARVLGLPLNTGYSCLRLARKDLRDAARRLVRRPTQRDPPL